MKRFIVLIITIILIMSMIVIPVKNVKADNSIFPASPDIITDKILILSSDPQLISTLQKGTLGIVSFNSGNYIGFDIPGGNLGTDIIVTLSHPILVFRTNPAALVLKEGYLQIYLSKIDILCLPWNYLSISGSEIKQSWFPQYISAQIVKIEDTGAYEKEVNYCCNPPVTHISYFYKLYLTSKIDPYNPPKSYNIEIGIMVPDRFIKKIQMLAANQNCIWIGLNGDNQIYIWLSH